MTYTISQLDIQSEYELQNVLRAVLSIQNKSFEATIAYSEDSFRRYLKKTKLILARDARGFIKGYCLYDDFQHPDSIHIWSIAVDPEARGNNLGSLMMQKAVGIASAKAQKTYAVTLECRPCNESYYKKLGFKVIKAPTANYYSIKHLHLPSIPMRASQLGQEKRVTKNNVLKQQNSSDLDQLIEFVGKVKHSTSFWYSSFFHSARKEKAFDAIYLELLATKAAGKTLSIQNVEDILRATLANSLIVRGSNKGTITASSTKALACLNSPEFAVLRALVSSNNMLTQADIYQFSGLKQRHSSDYVGSYPYSHFSRQINSPSINSLS
ncbi:MAG: N-acetyltransferase [Legionella sp.]|jgi:ribosomal protein S18 acetylase RimI-like enzyme